MTVSLALRTTAAVFAPAVALSPDQEVVLRLLVLFLIVASALLIARNAQAATNPPSWWVADALCVHDAWHYTPTWQRGETAEYHLFGHSFWRTWRISPSISNGEGAWTYNAGPQYGGLQMDSTFELDYGARFVHLWGHAGNWPVWAQLVTAFRGWRSQGWGAWPNTSVACGLR